MRRELHLPEGCALSVMFCLLSLQCQSSVLHCCDFDSVFLYVSCVLCATPAAAQKPIEYGRWLFIKSFMRENALFNKVHKQICFYILFFNFSVSLALCGYWIRLLSNPLVFHLPCSWLPPSGIFYKAYFIGGDTSCQMLPASSNTLTSCSVPFLLTGLVSVESSQRYKFSVTCTRLQCHHNVVMEKV